MKTFPMFLTMRGRRVVICGGGEQAAQKCRLMLKTEARIDLRAPELEPELTALHEAGRVEWTRGPIGAEAFAGAALVFIATGCPGIDASLHAIAKDAGAVVNVVDQPDLCDAITPSIVDRDPVVVAIGTEGTAPVLGRQIKTKVEQMLEPRLGDLAALAGRLRGAAAQRLGPRARRDLWRWVFDGPVRERFAMGGEREAARMVKDAIASGQIPKPSAAPVALVGAGPGAADLITLRGVKRLQEADIIFYDRLVDPALLELARRDAERVYVGKKPGCRAWPQERINGVIVAAAKQGKRVVRLKCGDPGVFARGAEEADALAAEGIACEIVPGVTSASACAAEAGDFLTERGKVDTLVLTTGASAQDADVPDWMRYLHEGARVAVYMGVGAAERITDALLRAGVAEQTEVLVVARGGMPDAAQMRCAGHELAGAIAARPDISNPAMIFLTLPKGEVVPGVMSPGQPELRVISA
ncbi:MAG: siroheme synthase CysG [Pseudomonadota bacterium]